MVQNKRPSPTRRHLLTNTLALGVTALTTAASIDVSFGAPPNVRQANSRLATGIVVAFGSDGSDVAAFIRAVAQLSSAGGGQLVFRRGVYEWSSEDLKALGLAGIPLPANCTIDGNGSVINITGPAQFSYVFTATDVSRVAITDLTVVGNGASTGYNNGAFMRFSLSSTASKNIDTFILDTVELRNFKAPWWVLVYNNNLSSLEIQHVRINGLRGISNPGNSLNPSNIGENAAVLAINSVSHNPIDESQAIVRDVIVTNFYAEATHIKQGVIFNNNVHDSEINGATVHNAGLMGGKDDTGCYALQVYGANNRNTRIINPTLISPRDNGIYAANGSDLFIQNAIIRGQTSAKDTTLPKAAISINSVRNVTISGGTLIDNTIDLALVINDKKAEVSIAGTQCLNSSKAGIRLVGTQANVGKVTISGARVVAGPNARALYSPNDSVHYINDVSITDCDFATEYLTAVEISATPTPARNWNFTNVVCTSRGTPFQATQFGGSMTIRNMRLVLLGGGTTGYSAFRCFGAGAMDVDGLTIVDQNAGTSVDTRNYVGSLVNVRLENSTTLPVPKSEGTAFPEFRGFSGARIQDLSSKAKDYREWHWRAGAWISNN